MDNLSVQHARTLFALLFSLSFLATPEDPLDDEILIFIRKLLSHASEHDKRMGVTAVAAAVNSFSTLSVDGTAGDGDGQGAILD